MIIGPLDNTWATLVGWYHRVGESHQEVSDINNAIRLNNSLLTSTMSFVCQHLEEAQQRRRTTHGVGIGTDRIGVDCQPPCRENPTRPSTHYRQLASLCEYRVVPCGRDSAIAVAMGSTMTASTVSRRSRRHRCAVTEDRNGGGQCKSLYSATSGHHFFNTSSLKWHRLFRLVAALPSGDGCELLVGEVNSIHIKGYTDDVGWSRIS